MSRSWLVAEAEAVGVLDVDHGVGVVPDVAVPISVDRAGGQPLSGERQKLFPRPHLNHSLISMILIFLVSAWLDGMPPTNPRPGLVQMVMERMGLLPSDENSSQEFSIFAVEISLLTVGSILVIVVVFYLCYRFGCQVVRCCRPPDPMARPFDLIGKVHREEDLYSFPSRSSKLRAQVRKLPSFYGRFRSPPPVPRRMSSFLGEESDEDVCEEVHVPHQAPGSRQVEAPKQRPVSQQRVGNPFSQLQQQPAQKLVGVPVPPPVQHSPGGEGAFGGARSKQPLQEQPAQELVGIPVPPPVQHSSGGEGAYGGVGPLQETLSFAEQIRAAQSKMTTRSMKSPGTQE